MSNNKRTTPKNNIFNYIIGEGNGKDLLANELAYAYLKGVSDGFYMDDDVFFNILENQEKFVRAMKESYLRELDNPKGDYCEVVQ